MKNIVYNFPNKQTKEFPRMVIAGVSFVCNAKCIHCVYNKFPETRWKMAGRSAFMEEEIFKKIADECSKYPGSLLRLVGFGEPILHPKIIDFIAYAKKVGCEVGIITNGSLLNREMSKKILETNIDAIDVSVDAFKKETYEKIRQGLNFDKLIENVKTLIALRNKMKKNTFIFCSIVEQKEVMPELGKALKFWNSVADKAVSRKFLTFGLLKKNENRTPYYQERIPCFLLYDRINIDVNGGIRQCGYDSFGKTNFGNLQNNTIKDAWHCKELNRIRECHQNRKFDQAGICSDCVDWPFHSWQKNYMADSYNKKNNNIYSKI